MIAICIAVAAIPEGLPIVITINMSIGVSRMAKQKAIIKNLASVETLGAANVICSDKTGTLTQNKMTLVDIYDFSSNKIYDVINNLNDISKKIIEYCVLCSNVSIEHQNNKVITTGDPTELAFIYAYNSFCNNTQEKLNDDCQRLFELPFDSNRKLMSSVNQIKDENYVITKGAVDQLIKCCNLTSKEVKTILKHNDLLASKGQRVLSVAIKKINKTKNPFNKSEIEKNLTFIGLVGLIDPPREEVKESINKCHQAGIKVVMITGDHVITAKVIGQQLNIFNKGDIAITGEELDQMSEKEFIKKIEKISVYARVSPANKLRIVNG